MPPARVYKKLIEVALPLDEINRAAAHEKSIRHGHPSTLHLWWARRPLAAARAVLFAQLVNDPSARYTEEELKKPQVRSAITRKRNELFKLVAELARWENTNNESVLSRARSEIAESWREQCEAAGVTEQSGPGQLYDPTRLPVFHDPFAGGGSIPLEAQRLGLRAHASDLNPVAVLINKAMVEIPPSFAGKPPVSPSPERERQTRAAGTDDWSGARGLAEDVRRYGSWVQAEAFKRIGHLYPRVRLKKTPKSRPELAPLVGKDLNIVAWLWARTVTSPNPALHGAEVPLTSTFLLSTKKSGQAWVETKKTGDSYEFVVRTGELSKAAEKELGNGTRAAKAQDFVCLLSGAPVTREYVREQGKNGKLGQRLMAVVAEGARGRVYLSPSEVEVPELSPAELRQVAEARRTFLSGTTPSRAQITGGVCSAYGLSTWGSLFTDRQVLALSTLGALVEDARAKATADAAAAGWPLGKPLEEGGSGARAYGDAVAVYLAFSISKLSDRGSTICTWFTDRDSTRPTFARQALPMTWDFAEMNVFLDGTGSFEGAVQWTTESLEGVASALQTAGKAWQQDACEETGDTGVVISTDPPYFDNISYAELSDFFYVWLRRALKPVMPRLFSTILVPKTDELVAVPYRHGGKAEAEQFFLHGMTRALQNMARRAHPAIPITVYYAFKQSETQAEGTSSTGWETFLDACLTAGLTVTGTWPIRTELSNRLVGSGANALASSIVLSFRPRGAHSETIARRDFLRELDRHMPTALREMTEDPYAAIAPVDLAQAAIGPGMAVFSKYSAVLEADGSAMTVHNALIHINKAIDDFFAHAEGELDSDTRFCIGWFHQYGVQSAAFGEADVLARAKGTSVSGLEEAGVVVAGRGKVKLRSVSEYPADWDPARDSRLSVWEACHQLCRALKESEGSAGALLARMPEKQDSVRQLAYRLYTLSERNSWTDEARAYNDLITSWPAIVDSSRRSGVKGEQLGFA